MSRGQENEPLTVLRNAEVFGIQKSRVGAESMLIQRREKLFVNMVAYGVVKTGNVLHENQVRWTLTDQSCELQQQRFCAVITFARVERGEWLAWSARRIQRCVRCLYMQLPTKCDNVNGSDVPCDEAARLVVFLVSPLEPPVIVHPRDDRNVRIQEAASQPPRTAKEVNGFDQSAFSACRTAPAGSSAWTREKAAHCRGRDRRGGLTAKVG